MRIGSLKDELEIVVLNWKMLVSAAPLWLQQHPWDNQHDFKILESKTRE